MIILYRKKFLQDEIHILFLLLLKKIDIKPEDIHATLLDEKNEYIGFEVNFDIHKKIATYLTSDSNTVVDFITSSGRAQLNKCQLGSNESAPMQDMYISIFGVDIIDKKLLAEKIGLYFLNKANVITQVVCIAHVFGKDQVNSLLSWCLILEILKKNCGKQQLLQVIKEEIRKFSDENRYAQELKKLNDLALEVSDDVLTMYSAGEAITDSDECNTLCKNLLRHEFIRNINDMGKCFSDRNLSHDFFERRRSWLSILRKFHGKDCNNEVFEKILTEEVRKFSHPSQMNYQDRLQKIKNTFSLNGAYIFSWYFKNFSPFEMIQAYNSFVQKELIEHMDEVNKYLKSSALEPKNSFLGFFNKTAQNFRAMRESWMSILNKMQREKYRDKKILTKLIAREINKFSNTLYAEKLQQFHAILSDNSIEIPWGRVLYLPFNELAVMSKRYTLQVIYESQLVMGLDDGALQEYKASLEHSQVVSEENTTPNCVGYRLLEEYIKVSEENYRQDSFLSVQELCNTAKLNQLNKLTDFQIKTFYRRGRALSGMERDNIFKTIDIFTRKGYRNHSVICHQIWSYRDYPDERIRYQEIISYCEKVGPACGRNAYFNAFVACIKLEKDFKNAIPYLHKSVVLGSFNAWVILQCIFFELNAYIYPDTTQHLKIATVSTPENRRLVAEVIASLIINNQVTAFDEQLQAEHFIRVVNEFQVGGFYSWQLEDTTSLLTTLATFYEEGCPLGVGVNKKKARELWDLHYTRQSTVNLGNNN